ncbi:hypothetical protein [Schlesneria paludicola]|uniref:hypothetical protein n=1 Tax=Schlesneria paludicola TaxID=360056 RepID=UPI00029A3477|nr:hypothetical protein [Schlesneria paludicola]
MNLLAGTRLAFLIGKTIPEPAPASFVRAIEEIEVIQGDTATGRDAFRITLSVGRSGVGAVEYDQLSTGLLDPLQRVAVIGQIGASPVGVLDGMILDHHFAPSTEPGRSKLILTGEDISVLMDFEEKNKAYPNQPDGIIAMQIVGGYAKYGLVPPVSPSGPMETVLQRVTTQTETDFAFLTRLAARNGHAFYAEPTPVPAVSLVSWGPERLGSPQSALTMNFLTGTTVHGLRFHLDAFSPREETLPATGALPGLGGFAGAQSTSPPLAAMPQAPVRRRMARDATKMSTARAQARLAAGRSASPDALVAEGELDVARYGQPLRARRLVGLQGAGPAHSGLYYVRQVTHRIRPRMGQYLQSFTMVREGRGSTTAVVRR